MGGDKRCRHCGKPLMRKTGEGQKDWSDRKACNRSCHIAWKNSKPIWQTFAEKTASLDNGCIVWVGYRDPKGYGRFSSQGGEILTHRLAYVMHYGVDLGDDHVLHRCDNPACCNPMHLFRGSNQDNMDDMVAKGRSSRRYGVDNPNWRHGKNCEALPSAQIEEERASRVR